MARLLTEAQALRLARRQARASGRSPRRRSNPPAREVYPEIEAIFARKTSGRWRGRYVHDFRPGSRICGLPNGDLLVTSAPRCPA